MMKRLGLLLAFLAFTTAALAQGLTLPGPGLPRASGGGPVVPARVVANSGIHPNGATAGTTVAITLPSPVASGNMLVVYVGNPNSPGSIAVTGVTDNLGNTYTAGPLVADIVTLGYSWSAFYCLNITNAPQTITATLTSSTAFATILVDGFSGVLASGAFDGTGGTGDQAALAPGTNAITTNSFTTTASGDLVVSATVNVSGGGAITPGTGYTAGVNSSPDFFSEYQVQSAAGSTAGTFTNAATDAFLTIAMAFKHQ